MIYLPKLLSTSQVLVRSEAPDKWALLDSLSRLLAQASPMANGSPLDHDTILREVTARERERTSALGEGCALPHARIEGLETPVACLATLSTPLDFDAPDRLPVSIVCLLLVPAEDPSTTLKVMAEVATLMVDEKDRTELQTAESESDILSILRNMETGEEHALRARNVMRPPYYRIHPDTPLTVITHELAKHNVEATSVVDHDGRVVGMVTCDQLFRCGLPEFFGQLKSVAFVKNFDPFENFFKGLKTAVAADVMTQDYAAVSEDATILEVVFELSVRKRPKVFVVRDGILVGIIDRTAVLDRVLNF